MLHIAVAAFVVVVLGTFIHEFGHTLCIMCSGIQLTGFNVLGLQLWPTIERVPLDNGIGRVWWFGEATDRDTAWILVGGSGLTWLVSVIALVAWCRRSFKAPLVRTAVLSLIALSYDVLCATLPTIGLRDFVFAGECWDNVDRAEFFYAAEAFGIPKQLLYVAIFGYPLVVATCITWAWRKRRSSRATAGDYEVAVI